MKTADIMQNEQGPDVIQPQQSITSRDVREQDAMPAQGHVAQGAGARALSKPRHHGQERPILAIMKRRRSVGQVTQEQPTRAQIECLLEAATYAPNHHTTEPWRFFVVTGGAREELGATMAESLRISLQDLPPEKEQVLLWKERNKPLRAPVIITVAVPADIKGLFIENVEAAAAAIQNMLLVAEEMGLATIWRTGDVGYDPSIKRWFGLNAEDHIVGFVYVGYSRGTRPLRTPTSFLEKTTWLS